MVTTMRDKYLNKEVKCMPQKELHKLQLERLKKVFMRARSRCSFYNDFSETHRALNVQIKSLEDIQKLPHLSKKEGRQAYPEKLLCVKREKIKQIHGSSGTTGKPTLIFATQKETLIKEIKMRGRESFVEENLQTMKSGID